MRSSPEDASKNRWDRVLNAAARGARRLTHYDRTSTLVLEKDLTGIAEVSTKARLVMRAAEPADGALLRTFHREHGVDRGQQRRVERYLERSDRGFLASLDDNLIGYVWWFSNRSSKEKSHPDLELYGIPLTDDQVYGFDFFVAPAYRSGSRALEFFARFERALAGLGYARAFGLVDAKKVPARWTYAALGWTTVRVAVEHTVFSVVRVVEGRVILEIGSGPRLFEGRSLRIPRALMRADANARSATG